MSGDKITVAEEIKACPFCKNNVGFGIFTDKYKNPTSIVCKICDLTFWSKTASLMLSDKDLPEDYQEYIALGNEYFEQFIARWNKRV